MGDSWLNPSVTSLTDRSVYLEVVDNSAKVILSFILDCMNHILFNK